MKTIKNPGNMLIIEEQMIVGIDLKRQLQKKGYSVVVGKTLEEVIFLLEKKNGDIVIASPKLLTKNESVNGSAVYTYINSVIRNSQLNLDTLILDGNPEATKRFAKPYDSSDLVEYITAYFYKNSLAFV